MLLFKRNDSETLYSRKKFNTNADEMARFLTSVNLLEEGRLNKMLTNHVRFSRQLAQHYLSGSYEDALRVMDEDYMNSLNMADTVRRHH